jgi:hypothetical protein
MKKAFTIATVLVVTQLPRVAHAQHIRIPTDAPITFAQCGGKAWHEYQVEHTARFVPDSSLSVSPTDTVGIGEIAQFVVDSLGHVIPESLYWLTSPATAPLADVRRALPLWRYHPATNGDKATCQAVVTSIRWSGRHADRPFNER